jgi:hypothetical protein
MTEQRDIDLKAAINAISDVVQNRPRPLREFDQIYMKSGDMVLQSELVGRCGMVVPNGVLFGDGMGAKHIKQCCASIFRKLVLIHWKWRQCEIELCWTVL